MTAVRRFKIGIVCALLGVASGADVPTPQGPAGEPSDAAAVETAPPPRPEFGPLREHAGRVSWRGVSIGMQMREVASLLQVQLGTDLVMEVGCGGEALELVVDGLKVLMGFTDHTRNAALHTLFVYVDPPVDRDVAVAALKAQLPGLRDHPASGTRPESVDARPVYWVGDPEIAVRVDPRGIWLSDTDCLE